MCLTRVGLRCITESSNSEEMTWKHYAMVANCTQRSDKAVHSHHYWSVLCARRAMGDITFLKVT